uniref:KIND domain-containing protein n=1 Tax=Cyclopterus lumpus TaxID=8103 RepID=A0A8C3AVR7_CYCLU
SEEEVWAVCAECVVALQSIRPSHLFHTLCITPDTLAFNAHGNVCFMEQLSGESNGHVYSLGSTLSAALNFVIEPELEAQLGVEIQRLLEQMQEEKPEDRPLLQVTATPPTALNCQSESRKGVISLSSVGRRVLSLESVSTFQGPFKKNHLNVGVAIWVSFGLLGAEAPKCHIFLFSTPMCSLCSIQWVSLRELLTRCGRRLTVNELWALCYTCLSSLQTYIDFPGDLKPFCHQTMVYKAPAPAGFYAFYLAPEYQEHGIVTEKVCVPQFIFKKKLTVISNVLCLLGFLHPLFVSVSAQVCVYGVAAVLWATAKFSLSPHQKLAMPRRLKTLLLEMAKRTPIERPTIATAKRVLLLFSHKHINRSITGRQDPSYVARRHLFLGTIHLTIF